MTSSPSCQALNAHWVHDDSELGTPSVEDSGALLLGPISAGSSEPTSLTIFFSLRYGTARVPRRSSIESRIAHDHHRQNLTTMTGNITSKEAALSSNATAPLLHAIRKTDGLLPDIPAPHSLENCLESQFCLAAELSISVPILTEALKYDEGNMNVLPVKRRKIGDERASREQSCKQKKSLTFCEVVRVIPIPMRSEYCERSRSLLWSNAMEIHENALRNAREFASEGCV